MKNKEEDIKEESTIFKDCNGNTSSKRIGGYITGFVYLLLIVYSIIVKEDITINQTSLINSVGFVAGGLLGIGVFEKKINKI